LSKILQLQRSSEGASNRTSAKPENQAANRGNAMTGITIDPLFTGSLKLIRPAIGIIDNMAYVGVWIPSKIKAEGTEIEREVLHLVTDTGELIPAEETKLAEKGLRLAYKPVRFPERWPMEDVKNYHENRNQTPDPVECLSVIEEQWRKYFEFSDETQYLYETIWDIGTYFAHPIFRTYSYDYKGGIKGVGKTKALSLSYCEAFNAVASNNMSASALFRLIQNASCTLQIDETEKLRNPERAQDFRTILLAGYKKGMPVYRVEKTAKDQFVPEPFDIFGPKRIANIAGLEDVLSDRCIPSIMKKGRTAVINTEIEINDPIWAKIRSLLYRLFLCYWREVKAIYDRLTTLGDAGQLSVMLKSVGVEKDLSAFTGRDLEVWKPLLTLALFFDSRISEPSYTRRLVDFALERIREKVVENVTQTADMILAGTLVKLTCRETWLNGYHAVKEIREAMLEAYDEEQRWLSNEWCGRALRRLGFVDKRRLGTGIEVRLEKAVIRDLANRLGIGEGSEGNEGSEGTESNREKADRYVSVRTLPALPTQPTPIESQSLPPVLPDLDTEEGRATVLRHITMLTRHFRSSQDIAEYLRGVGYNRTDTDRFLAIIREKLAETPEGWLSVIQGGAA
jgi:hypothetical protein